LEQRVRERTAELEAESERRRYLAKRLVEVLEEDRRDLSMMLHDDIGQIVAGSKMQIDNLKNDLSGIDHDVPARIDPILEALQGIMASLRSRSRQLRPSSLDTLGLAAALRSISTGASTCRIRYHIPEEPDEVRPDLKLAIFRIAQEAVTNALKHADCGEIQLSLVKRDDVLTLMVEDNGRGFSYDEMASSETGQGPLGLLIMRERAVNAGGELRVESAPGKGTTVIAGFPLGGNPDTTEGEP
jgi:signal transduction histidine kinase